MTQKRKPKTKLQDLRVDEVSFVDKGANNKRYYLTKAADPAPSVSPTPEPTPEISMDVILKADGTLDAEHPVVKAALEAAAAAAVAAASASDAEKVEKAVAEKVAAAQAEAEKVVKAAEDRAAAAEAEKEAIAKRLATEEEAKEVSEAIRKCATDYQNLPAKAEVLGPDLRTVRKADAALADRLESLLKSLDALAAQALTPIGSAKSEDKADTAWGEIQKRAQVLMKAEKLSEAAAIDRVLTADKSLYTAYEAEKVR